MSVSRVIFFLKKQLFHRFNIVIQSKHPPPVLIIRHNYKNKGLFLIKQPLQRLLIVSGDQFMHTVSMTVRLIQFWLMGSTFRGRISYLPESRTRLLIFVSVKFRHLPSCYNLVCIAPNSYECFLCDPLFLVISVPLKLDSHGSRSLSSNRQCVIK